MTWINYILTLCGQFILPEVIMGYAEPLHASEEQVVAFKG